MTNEQTPLFTPKGQEAGFPTREKTQDGYVYRDSEGRVRVIEELHADGKHVRRQISLDENGLPHGTSWATHANGMPKYSLNYVHGVRDGKVYTGDRYAEEQGQYKNAELHGKLTMKGRDGKKHTEYKFHGKRTTLLGLFAQTAIETVGGVFKQKKVALDRTGTNPV